MTSKSINNNKIKKTGVVKDVLGSARFKVVLEDDGTPDGKLLVGKEVVCTLCGKMYQKRIKIVKGDRVDILIMVFSSDSKDFKGVIVFRLDS
jgi:translation initiation factor IF-1